MMFNCQDIVVETINIPKDFVKTVIGHKEERLKLIRETSNCRIEIRYKTTPQGICKITGTRNNVIIALRLIREVYENEIEKDDFLPPLVAMPKTVYPIQNRFTIPPSLPKHRSVKAEDGKMIKMLQEQLGDKLMLPYIEKHCDPLLLNPVKTVNVTETFEDEDIGTTAFPPFIDHDIVAPTNDGITQTETIIQDEDEIVENDILQNSDIESVYDINNLNLIEEKISQQNPSLADKNVQTESNDKNKKYNSVRLGFQKVKSIFGRKHPKHKNLSVDDASDVNDIKKLPGNVRDNITNKKLSDTCKNDQPILECGICFENFKVDDGSIKCEGSPFVSTIVKEEHSICVDCLRGYAHSAITDAPVAHGGLGLKCVSTECKNIFLLTSFEFYLCDEDYLPLKFRLQEQCIADASLEDLVTCSDCGLRVCAPQFSTYFVCSCGRRQCRFCPRLYNGKHEEKTCEEMSEEEIIDASSKKIESKISEAVIRKCHKCGIAFVKNEGCNKMTCRCGAKQCYVCHEKQIDYNHFCTCGDVQQQHGRCKTCKKGCRLWENAEELDQIKIHELQQLPIINRL